MCAIGHTCCKDTTGESDGFFIVCRESAPDASRLRRGLARILLCDATTVVVMFSSLVARLVRQRRLSISIYKYKPQVAP
jgi:hypothetical protein